MVAIKKQSHSWWFEGHNSPRRSTWLQSTLTELDVKTIAMLKVIEEDADSFAQRAEMYYKKRPELINMVEDFYRTHRSLAERFDLVKQDSLPRLFTAPGSPTSLSKTKPERFIYNKVHADLSYDSYSETCDFEENEDSEVDDPDQENETLSDAKMEKNEIPNKAADIANEEVMMKLRGEIEKLKEENQMQKDLSTRKDEEKRDVIRQLSIAVEMLKDENVKLRKYIAAECPKRKNPIEHEFKKLRDKFLGKFFSNGSSKHSETTVVAL